MRNPTSNSEQTWQSQKAQDDHRLAFQVVSPPFSCGVAWLINALLYLDIRVTNSELEPGHWEIAHGGFQMSEKASSHLKWHMPVLHDRETFVFEEDKEVFWEHRLDFADNALRPTILFLRDPRDAIHSFYQRNYARNIDFVSYLKRPDEWPHHFPGLFQLPPIETFAYFSWFWLAMGEVMPLKLIRFEDAKQSPVQVIRDVLRFLGLERTTEQILGAIDSSGFENAKRAMVSMEQATGREFKTVHRAQIGEWKEAYSFAARRSIRKIGKAILGRLGYGAWRFGSMHDPVREDYRDAITRKLPVTVRSAALQFLEETERGNPPDAGVIADYIVDRDIGGFALLKLASIIEAIYYVKSTFIDTSSHQARLALNTFVNLNLWFFDQWSIQIAAWLCIRRLEARTGTPLVARLGIYWRVKYRLMDIL